MKKIRINELARELEVKPGVIIEMLPELGVQEKKTHSSSVDEDVALELRHRLLGPDAPPRDPSGGEAESNGHQAIASDAPDADNAPEMIHPAETVVAAASSAGSNDAGQTQTGPAVEPGLQALRADESFRAPRPPQPALGRPAIKSAPALPLPPPAPSRSTRTASPAPTPEGGVPGIPAQPVPGEEERPAPSFQAAAPATRQRFGSDTPTARAHPAADSHPWSGESNRFDPGAATSAADAAHRTIGADGPAPAVAGRAQGAFGYNCRPFVARFDQRAAGCSCYSRASSSAGPWTSQGSSPYAFNGARRAGY